MISGSAAWLLLGYTSPHDWIVMLSINLGTVVLSRVQMGYLKM